ncbi:MAG: hypothetical protein IJ589_03935 [Lachnospiraceae bacterium]|nr:hypothetical protein [Lachnospiraceae bacterium]
MTISEFIGLFPPLEEDTSGILIETEEYRYCGDRECRRADAARILHQYLKKIKKFPDLTDFSTLKDIKDLYDCRICANAIAQALLRKIMEPVKIPTGESSYITIFDLETKITREEAESAISRVISL